MSVSFTLFTTSTSYKQAAQNLALHTKEERILTKGEGMELSFPVPKIQKHLDDCVGNISRLPDDVLSHVFSFLPTKDVVRTSILSKRWENVWTLAPNVDFNDQIVLISEEYECKFSLFKDFVNGVLFNRGGLSINKCFLGCGTQYSSTHIYAWICAVLTCNVQDLTIKSTAFDIKELPWGLFTCKTLVHLEITGSFVINLPFYVCFPALKKLHLDSVVYVDDCSMQRLFSSCVVLEELYLQRTRGDCVLIANIFIPSLKRLSLVVPLLEPIAGHRYETNIDAPYLEYLELDDDSASKDYSVNFSKSLVEAHIDGRCSVSLEDISNVQLLTFSGEAMENLSYSSGSYGFIWPTFHNLVCLELGVSHIVGWKLLTDLLENSPNLKALVFPEGLVEPKDRDDGFYGFYWIPPDCVPGCLLSHLEEIEVHNFAGRRCEIFLMRYMLEHAQVLKQVTIHWYDFDLSRKKTRNHMSSVEYEILSFGCCSADCEIEFFPME